ncbi:coniferyl-aldehyde dehydrogenase [Pseudomonas citronellolis]|nr:coniferyl-aldehyde dehydrogenase [Pseudomonas citronellolis]MCP1667822.1 coniferyl-aldehyde dehydrogenase [Pseudomonas citronellolis]MCP1699082.1 coniferyl-aldehyde dehydrogenase [Pseudomonas citronellolis]MCP1704929.1 coniferyl-aldehyde dehydrogenase [Pseudomonas citronellolis]MCP1799645.1 coniferyl-aldehyde dehydrogenase [Pseudomonas citronellolis]
MTQETAAQRTTRLFATQREAYRAHPYPSLAERKARLRALRTQLRRYQDLIATAMSADFGHRSGVDTRFLDLLGCVLHINHSLRHLRHWMKASPRRTELLFKGNSLRVEYQPKGVVGVISAWNFPVYIGIAGLVSAIAAGNRVMLKMSEFNPRTNQVLRQMLAEVFSEDEVALVGGELEDPNVFSSLPFDHLVFTGSPGVGRIVMRTAAANLTPVTLELGGKSPAVVLPDYDLADAARRIVHGKGTNGGQICIAPDYALVPQEHVPAFVEAVRGSFQALYGTHPAGNDDYTSIIDERQFQRLQGLLDDARAKGAQVVVCGETALGRRMPLHVLTEVTPDMRVMQEEIFGPLLPVLGYTGLEQVLRHIGDGERPLALYVFSTDSVAIDELLRHTHSGGVTVNDWGWHALNHGAPFGGLGNSGMGNYHGEEGFRELSHARSVFRRRTWFPTQLFHPPYGTRLQNWVLKRYLGSADPRLKPLGELQ